MSYSGDAAFKAILAQVLRQNELGNKTPYQLYFATKSSVSGWSFGVPQWDLSVNQFGRDLLTDILQKATYIDANGATQYFIEDNDPNTGRPDDTVVLDLIAKARIKGGASLSPAEQAYINGALSSAYGMSAIDAKLDAHLEILIGDADRVINLVANDANRSFLQTELGTLFLCDYDNQYHIDVGGKLEKFLTTGSTTLTGGAVAIQGTLGVDDLLNFYFRTQQAGQTPWDPMRRFANIAAAANYSIPNTPDGLEEAKGVLRAYTYLYVPHEDQILATDGGVSAVNNFKSAVCKPAEDLVLGDLTKNYGITVDPNYDDVLVGDDTANNDKSGEYQLNGRDGNDIILGEGGNDTIDGGAGNDILIGGSGNDTMTGGDGTDIYVFKAGDGQDTIFDSDGKGKIIENGTQLVGTTAQPTTGSAGVMQWVDAASGTKYQFTPGLTFAVSGTGTMVITPASTSTGQVDTITINKFDLNQAIADQTGGYLGIHFKELIAIKNS